MIAAPVGRPGTAVPPWALAATAMLAVQLSSALSVGVIEDVGAAGTAWLRLTFGALVLVVLVRPPLRAVRRADVPAVLALGVTTGLVTVLFLGAIARIPLGTAVAIEFLGPLTLAAARGGSARALVWPVLALAGVLLLTAPWHGAVDATGVGMAVLAAVGWAVYIALTQHLGDRFVGLGALALTVPVAAATAAVVGVPQAAGHLSVAAVAVTAGLALVHPVLSYALELLALRRMTASAFGTLMALEPGFGVVLGVLVLHQDPRPSQVVGIALVVLAGGAAQRGGRREHAPPLGDAEAARPA
ncbi:EamA family transporter [Patulibacter sp. SYSU D01012]|uniref:EamA family transporter n=1 Tax=Patulibacter sp. SYSU D01012 TaxID=2817381 RepID=UPI001B30DC98|nr:EamA family transporter [Patulibacter sp. SYSU D01012]